MYSVFSKRIHLKSNSINTAGGHIKRIMIGLLCGRRPGNHKNLQLRSCTCTCSFLLSNFHFNRQNAPMLKRIFYCCDLMFFCLARCIGPYQLDVNLCLLFILLSSLLLLMVVVVLGHCDLNPKIHV